MNYHVGRIVGVLSVVSVLQAEACNTDTTPTQPHRNSNTHLTKNNTTNVVIQQNSRKLLMMGIRGLLEKYPTFGREKETGLLGALNT